MPAYYKYLFFLVTSCGSDHLESICYYGHYAPLLFFFPIYKTMFSLFSPFYFILAVVNDINSAKIKNLESWIYNTVQVLLAQYMTYVPWETLITVLLLKVLYKPWHCKITSHCFWPYGCTTVGIYCIGVGGYKIFDSHSRDVHGMAHPQGTCVLLEVPTLRELKNYFQTLHTNSGSLFELRGIKIDTGQCHDTDTLTDQP